MADEKAWPSILTVIGGPNGAGKSTIAEKLQRSGYDIGTFVNPDIIAARLGGPENTKDLRAGRKTLKIIKELIDKGESFTRETTLTSHEIIRTMRDARKLGYMVNLIYVCVEDVSTSKARVRNRVALGGHDIPEDVQERRFQKSLDNAPRAAREADYAIFYHNGAKGHELVAEALKGRVTHTSNSLPNWTQQVVKALRAS